jgi:hypothetical protein
MFPNNDHGLTNLEELNLLKRTIQSQVFHFIVVQYNHYSLVHKTKDFLKNQYPNLTHKTFDLTENEDQPKIYIEKDYRNYTLKEDGIEFVKVQQCCPGCFPHFQLNQLAHMDPGGCLFYQEEFF